MLVVNPKMRIEWDDLFKHKINYNKLFLWEVIFLFSLVNIINNTVKLNNNPSPLWQSANSSNHYSHPDLQQNANLHTNNAARTKTFHNKYKPSIFKQSASNMGDLTNGSRKLYKRPLSNLPTEWTSIWSKSEDS